MVNQEIITRFLGLLRQYAGELKNEQHATWEEFSQDTKNKRFVERTLQMCIEVCLDIGNHIISDEGWKEAETNRDIFLRLKEKEVVSDDLLNRLLQMAGFRNRIIHDYAEIEPEMVYGILKNNLKDFDSYASEILNWLEKKRKGSQNEK